MLGLEIHSFQKKLGLKEPLNDVMLDSENCSGCHMALWTNDFVDQTFGGYNWSPTVKLVTDS